MFMSGAQGAVENTLTADYIGTELEAATDGYLKSAEDMDWSDSGTVAKFGVVETTEYTLKSTALNNTSQQTKRAAEKANS